MNFHHAPLYFLAVVGSACLIGGASVHADTARVTMATAPSIAVTDTRQTHPSFKVQIAVAAGELVRVDLTCTLLANETPPISLRPVLHKGRATPLADIPFAVGGINAPTPAATVAVWKAEISGILQFSAETKGTGELVGCSLLATRLQ